MELFKYLIHIHLQKMYVIYALLCFLAFSFTVQGMDCSNLDWNWLGFFFKFKPKAISKTYSDII